MYRTQLMFAAMNDHACAVTKQIRSFQINRMVKKPDHIGCKPETPQVGAEVWECQSMVRVTDVLGTPADPAPCGSYQ